MEVLLVSVVRRGTLSEHFLRQQLKGSLTVARVRVRVRGPRKKQYVQ